VHVHNLLNRVRKVRATLEAGIGRPPTNEEMAEELHMTVGKYSKMLALTRRSISLEVPKYQSNPKDLGHESEDLLGDSIGNSGSALEENTPERRVDRGLFQDDLQEMLSILDDDERSVISARYGLSDGLTRTVTAVASQMKQSKAWVRSQECRALRKLRRPWYEKKLKEHQAAMTV
jgi:DNA-directed RNA polymerase sigma subunit (sigma70/sigma32)